MKRTLLIAILASITASTLFADGWKKTIGREQYQYIGTEGIIAGDRVVIHFPNTPIDITKEDAFSLEAEVSHTDGDWAEIGLVFGSEKGDYQYYIINPAQSYHTLGVHKGLNLHKGWNDTFYARPTDDLTDSRNRIKVIRKGEQLILYINGRESGRSKVGQLDGRGIGIYVRGNGIVNIHQIIFASF